MLRALGLGDLLTAVPALRALARAFPRHDRVLAAPSWLGSLTELIEVDGAPALHRVVDSAPLSPLAAELQRPDVAVNLHGRGPQSHRLLLDAHPAAAIWFECPAVPQSRGSPRWRRREHEVPRWCRLLSESGVPADPRDLYLAAPHGAPTAAAGATLIHPGAASGARRWPVERYAHVVREELAQGRRVVVTGGPDERHIAEMVAAEGGLDGDDVLAGRTDLKGLVRLVADAGRVVCGDTGVAHLATALGTPSVVLFGPTSPELWGPPQDARHRILWRGGTGDPHGSRPDPGLLEISADEVVAELRRLPQASLAPC